MATADKTALDLSDVLIRDPESGVTWTRAEVYELADALEMVASAKVMSGEQMRKKDADQDRAWCRNQATFAALALRTLVKENANAV